ncbi:tetratricopeptide repeat protein [Nodosilinea sp. P-1105]|uniref:tetratricopeptide repeat protein n=1 Tax=Nodosilinea sp. P-1105 TaxID=2546229 RepID=UPI00146B28AD|nr:tetratricopeptide repeat protein [Nodosilinea sp. P-1105]NMF82551.1 tetratricopeptide repeat protein [Nodosilinea sp. P-1105]
MAVKRLIDGRFQFNRVLSTKSYSKTYLMTDHGHPDKPKCIVKHLQLPVDNPITLKFLNDLLGKRVKLLKRMGDHGAIAKNIAVIQEDNDFYWVRDFIPGHSLQAELAEDKPRPEVAVQAFLAETLGILTLIQKHGVVHQNLHPSNLIRHKGGGHLVIVDFSLIHETETPKPIDGANGSSPTLEDSAAYLPQLQSRDYPRFAADHFALGIMALKLATGLSTEALPQLHQADFLAQVKLQLDECSTLGEGLKTILLKMVSPNPAMQFQQAKDIVAALSGLVDLPAPAAAGTVTHPDHSLDKDVSGTATHDLTAPHPLAQSLSPRWLTPKLGIGLGLALALLGVGIWGLGLPQRLATRRQLAQAEQAYQAGRTADAISHLDQLLQRSPNHGEALARRSSLFLENGQSDKALQDLTNAIEANPNVPLWHYQRGNLRLRIGDFQGAIADYTHALELDETYSDAYINRGNARAELGDEAGAIQDYTAALGTTQEAEVQADAYLNRCLSKSNLGDHKAALDDCVAAVNLRPNNSLAYENRGLVKRRLNDYQGAIQDFTIAIQMSSSSAEPYYNRGLARQDLGDFLGAMDDFTQAINLNPDHPFAYYDRGLLYAEMGEIDQAIADLEIGARVCLDVSRTGCFDDAQYQLQKLRQLDSDQI